MKDIHVFDPHEVSSDFSYHFGIPENIDNQILDPEAIQLWNTVMRSVYDSHGKRILRSPDTVSQSLARKLYEFMHDPIHTSEKFDHDDLTAKEVYRAAKFSKSKWNRISSGKLSDIERGNVFALAIALRLDADQTAELMYSAGFAINYELDLDAAMMYFINNKIYDMNRIYSVLGNFSDIDNGLDCFVFQPLTEKQKPKRLDRNDKKHFE